MNELELKYGCNPNQKPARIFMQEGELPIRVLCGKPGYINFLDAFNGWQLVRELKRATGLPAAASFKHVSPAGAAVGLPLIGRSAEDLLRARGRGASPLGLRLCPRARRGPHELVRGLDRAVRRVRRADGAAHQAGGVATAIIAPGYEPEALEILKAKRKGAYNIVQIDPAYEPQAAGAQGRVRHHLRAEPKRAGDRRGRFSQTWSRRKKPCPKARSATSPSR